MSNQNKIILSAGAIYWIHQHYGVSQTYIKDFIKAPLLFGGSAIAKAKILDGIEAFKKHEAEIIASNERKLNALLSTSHE